MAEPVHRSVDAHVHHWDPSRVEWYPFLASDDALRDLGMTDVSAMRRLYDQEIYFGEASKWNVEKYVHVSAAVGGSAYLAETAERQEEADRTGHPDAIIGTLDAHLPLPEMLAHLDQQASAAAFRGIRFAEGLDHTSESGRAVLTELADRNLVYDLVVHPDGMLDVVRALEPYPSLTVVVEHTGWPLSEDDEHVRVWREGMSQLAKMNDQTHCKLSGLAMTLNRFDVSAFRPWIEHCLTVFGDERCFFASNFPVDGMFGTFDQLYETYSEVTAGLGADARDRLFAANAERVYRC
jgi:L-fuconolactonase